MALMPPDVTLNDVKYVSLNTIFIMFGRNYFDDA